jgi:hypothetical protein
MLQDCCKTSEISQERSRFCLDYVAQTLKDRAGRTVVHGVEALAGAGAICALPGRESWAIKGREAEQTGGAAGLYHGVVRAVAVGIKIPTLS